MTLHPGPKLDMEKPHSWRVRSSSLTVFSGDPLAHVKTANKLPQILARTEAEEKGAEEALLFNEKGEVVEAASGNVFFLGGSSYKLSVF